MKRKHDKITITVMVSLMTVSLIWNLIFALPSVSSEVSGFIHANPITNMIEDSYDNFLTPQICILVSFVNLCYAIAGLYSIYKSQESIKSKWQDIGFTLFVLYPHLLSIAFLSTTFSVVLLQVESSILISETTLYVSARNYKSCIKRKKQSDIFALLFACWTKVGLFKKSA